MVEYQPAEIANELEIAPQTLRKWATAFRKYLSGGASGAIEADGHARHRRYDESDLATLRAIKLHLDTGLDYAGVARVLDDPSQTALQNATGAIRGQISLPALTRFVESQIAPYRMAAESAAREARAASALAATRDEMVIELRGRVAELVCERDAALAGPSARRRRWFGRG